MNDHCKVAGGSDSTFSTAIYEYSKDHPNFDVSVRREWSSLFGISHYAGLVEYDAEGFIEKNKDEFPKEGIRLLSSSNHAFVKKIAVCINAATGSNLENPSSTKKRNRKTVGAQFVKQLQMLRSRINKTYPHYIRCFKPNSLLVAESFDRIEVASQLRCSGVLESLKISRSGYSGRFTHADFVKRYKILGLTHLHSNASTDITTLISAILSHVARYKSLNNVDELTQEERYVEHTWNRINFHCIVPHICKR